MTSTSITGLAINKANFDDLTAFCQGWGSLFAPSKNALKIPQQLTLSAVAKTAMDVVDSTKVPYSRNSNAREVVFDGHEKYSTRIKNSAETCGATKQNVDDIKTINNRIQGKRAKAIKDEPLPPVETTDPNAPEEHKHISISQRSVDNIIDNFSKIGIILAAEPLYTPNEADLKITAINTYITSLKNSNKAVVDVTPAYSNALINRNKVFYDEVNGLVTIALEIKKYVKSAFGATSPQYKQISKLKFTRPKKKK